MPAYPLSLVRSLLPGEVMKKLESIADVHNIYHRLTWKYENIRGNASDHPHYEEKLSTIGFCVDAIFGLLEFGGVALYCKTKDPSYLTISGVGVMLRASIYHACHARTAEVQQEIVDLETRLKQSI